MESASAGGIQGRTGGQGMRVADIMTGNPVCCLPATPLVKVARLMVENSCGAIPVLRSADDHAPAGIITDRDVTVRTVALGNNPLALTAGDVMTPAPIAVSPEDPVAACAALMREHRVRRLLVLDSAGRVCGLVAQAQIALNLPRELGGGLVKDISLPPPST